MLASLFRRPPLWQSVKPAQRRAAVSGLNPARSDDLNILLSLAREDADASVRCAALAVLTDPDTLHQLHKRDQDEGVRQAAADRLCQLLAAESTAALPLPERLGLLCRLDSPALLLSLIASDAELELKLGAIAQLHDEAQLETLARQSGIARLRLAAAEKLQDPVRQEALAAFSQHKDKAVYKLMRQRLDARAEQEKRSQQQQEKASALCQAMEAHARASLNPLYAAKAESLRQQWQELGCTEACVNERFETAFATAWQQITAAAAAAQREADAAQAREEMQQCILTLEATLQAYQGQDDFDLPALAALCKTQTLRWQLASSLQPAPADWQQRYQQASLQLEKLQGLLLQWQQDQQQLMTITASTAEHTTTAPPQTPVQQELLQLQQRYQRDYPGLHLPQALLARLASTPRAPTAAADVGHEFKRQLEKLQQALSAGHSRDAGKLLRQAQDFARQHQLATTRLQELAEQLRELQSWAGFVVQEKKQALIARMQALLQHDMEPDDKADAIHALQEEWKALGGSQASGEKVLWEQFKAAADLAYEPCRQHFALQRELRLQNLQKRQQLLAQLQDWQQSLPREANGAIAIQGMDWKQLDDILRTARAEWQRYQPCERQQGQILQKEFQALMNALDSLRQSHQDGVAAAKRELIARMQALQALDDVRAACNQAKQLQQDWKPLGQAHPRLDHKLWQEFRLACDAVFARRDADQQARQQAEQEQLQQAQDLLQAYANCNAQLQAAAADTSDSARHQTLQAEAARLEQAFAGLSLPRTQAATWQQRMKTLHAQNRQAVQTWQQQQQQARLQARLAAWQAQAESLSPEQAQQQMLDLEILLDLPSPAALQGLRQARQMQRLQSHGLRRGGRDEAQTLLTQFLGKGVAAAQQEDLRARLLAVLMAMDR